MLLEQICLLPHANIHHYSETSKELHENRKNQLEAFVEMSGAIDLSGGTLTVPPNCTLKFEEGTIITNGTLAFC